MVNNNNKLLKYREINNLNLNKHFKKSGFTLPIFKVLLKNQNLIKETILDSKFKKDYCNLDFEKYFYQIYENLINKSNQHKISLLYNLSSWI